MKTYKEFVNENITKFMSPKSEDDILKGLEGLSDNDKIHRIIKYQLDFDLLPRDENGVCVCNGDLFCDNNELTELPSNLMVKGDFWCDDNNLTSLSDNLTVGGSLCCHRNNLSELPDNLVVGGDLFCIGNKVKLTLPPTAKVGGKFEN